MRLNAYRDDDIASRILYDGFAVSDPHSVHPDKNKSNFCKVLFAHRPYANFDWAAIKTRIKFYFIFLFFWFHYDKFVEK